MPDVHAPAATLARTTFAGPALSINLVEHPSRMIGLDVPVTLIVILPTRKRLLEPGRDLRSPETAALLNRWAALHGIRAALGLTASVVYLWALASR